MNAERRRLTHLLTALLFALLGCSLLHAATVTNLNLANQVVQVSGSSGQFHVSSTGTVTTTDPNALRGLYALGFVDTSAFTFYAAAPTGTADSTTFLRGDYTYSATLTGSITADGIVLPAAGDGISIKTGTNATMGRATCNGVTEVTVATTKVTATSNIFLTEQVPAGTVGGIYYVSSRSAGVSFGMKCAASDTSSVAWLLIEPAP